MELMNNKNKMPNETEGEEDLEEITDQQKQELTQPNPESKEFINLELPGGIKFACGTSKPELSVFNLLDMLNWFLQNYDSLVQKKDEGHRGYLG